MSVDPLCTDDDMLKDIVQSVGIQCDQVPAHVYASGQSPLVVDCMCIFFLEGFIYKYSLS